uniref:D-lactate dehydratase n=1 Tax=Ditylenchus dipsaci TaxID=166011 RepID=A0A915CWS1_9BILA
MSGKSALIIGSNGSEDIELVTTSDVLRRANIQVIIAGLQDEKVIKCAEGTSINVDRLLNDVIAMEFDAVILPGGEIGSQNLAKCKRVGEILRRHEKNGSIVAAICAAPVALAIHGIGKGGRLTSYPSVKDLIVTAGYEYSEENVCVCKNVVTSRGPGTTFEFAMMLVELLLGKEKRQMLSNGMLLK